jgi:hypothetical protein
MCSLDLQDVSTPNLQTKKDNLNNAITIANNNLTNLNQQLVTLNNSLSIEETKYLESQKNFMDNYMSCTGITKVMITAQNDLSKYVEVNIIKYLLHKFTIVMNMKVILL